MDTPDGLSYHPRPDHRSSPMSTATPRKPLVFYHAGLGKVASTYLQKRVFPALDGIRYIHRNRFRTHRRVIGRGEHERYLISRECGKYLDRRLAEIASIYPEAHVLLFFRRHDEWIASHYRRYVKNGGHRPLDAYLDIDADTGIWKRDQLVYMDMIDRVTRCFGRPPFVLTYDRMKRDPADFNRRLCDHLGARIDPARLGSSPVHRSYPEARLAKLRRLNRRLDLADPEDAASEIRKTRVNRRLALYRSYLLLAMAGLIRELADGRERLTPDDTLAAIRRHYADDWQSLLAYEASQFEANDSGHTTP